MLDKSKPMNLGDIFNITINLVKETFLRNLVIAAVFFIPMGIIVSIGFDYLFSTMFKSIESSINNGPANEITDIFGNIFTVILIYSLIAIALTFCTVAVMIGVTYIGKMQLFDKRVSVNKTFRVIFSMIFWRAIGQGLVIGLVFGGIFAVPFIIIILSGAANSSALVVIGVLLMIAAIFVTVFLYIRWYFAFTAIVSDDLPVFSAFSKSFMLVNNYWWRTLGLVILIAITVQFAISVITTPVSFVVMWDFFAGYFKLIAEGDLVRNDPSQIFSLMKSIGYSIGIIITISSMLQYIIAPLFNVTLYYDLKIRKNDFVEETGEISESPTTA